MKYKAITYKRSPLHFFPTQKMWWPIGRQPSAAKYESKKPWPNLIQDSVSAVLVLHLVADDVEEGSGIKEPEDEPQLLLVDEAGVVRDHVLVVAARHGLRSKSMSEFNS